MPKFGETSSNNLETCHPDIIRVCNEAIKGFDFSVLCGIRGASDQMFGFRQKKSHLVYPLSNHNPKYNDCELPLIADILGCEPFIPQITEAIKTATEDQLIEIDANAPLGKSRAVDIAPYLPTIPHIDWRMEQEAYDAMIIGEKERFYDILKNIGRWHEMAGRMMGVAQSMGINLKWGGYWKDFKDCPHFELVA